MGAADDYALVLYPFISGETGMKLGMSERQWTDFGATLRQIHSTIVTSEGWRGFFGMTSSNPTVLTWFGASTSASMRNPSPTL